MSDDFDKRRAFRAQLEEEQIRLHFLKKEVQRKKKHDERRIALAEWHDCRRKIHTLKICISVCGSSADA